MAKEVRDTLGRNWDFIWALKNESNLDWQRIRKEKEQDTFWSFFLQQEIL